MKMALSFAQGFSLILLLGTSHAFKFGVNSGLRGGKSNIESDAASNSTASAAQKVVVQNLLNGRYSASKAISIAATNMDPEEAMRRLEGKLPAEVVSLAKMATSDKDGQTPPQFTEVSLAKARVILNGLIENSWIELDNKVIECKEFEERNRGTFTQVVADMARLSAQIAALEKEEARANNAIEAADSARSTTEEQMSTLKQEYHAQKLLDDAEMTKRKADLAVFDFILNLTACSESTFFLQGAGVQVCEVSGGRLELNFESKAAQQKLRTLMTPEAGEIIEAALSNFRQSKMALMSQKQAPTFFSNQTVAEPPTAMPETLPVNEEPHPDGQWKKCTQEPNCGLLHDTMSLEWGKFRDEVDSLQALMTRRQDEFLERKHTLNDMLTMLSAKKAAEMVALDDATAKKGTDQGELKDKTEQRRELQHEYTMKMEECDKKISEILFTNICAVRSVRNEVMEFSTISPQSKISDCDVQDWIPGDCEVACDDTCPQVDPYACGGWQMLTRAVVVAPNVYGVKCPPLQRKKKCNQFKCPVDCKMSLWTGWGKCSKDCEGGVQSKTRSVLIRPKNGGEMCDTVQESRSCNTGSCDRNCELHEWSEWSPCSMACSTGLQERVRTVEIPIRGGGTCPDEKNHFRLEEQECNTQACKGDELCIATQDLLLLIDASGSLRDEGYQVVKNFAANLTDRYMTDYKGDGNRVRLGAVLFGNGHLEPNGVITPAIRLSGLGNNTLIVKNEILATKWQRGFTNLAQAFVLADTMLQQRGRPAAQSAVMVIWDGKYSFKFETGQKAQALKDKNVQIYMAVIAGRVTEDQKKYIHKWASSPWATNLQHIPGLDSLEARMDEYIGKVIAKFCPASMSPSQQSKIDSLAGYVKIKQFAIPSSSCAHTHWLGSYTTVEECASAAKQYTPETQIFVFESKFSGRGKDAPGNCGVAPDFEKFDLGTYRLWREIGLMSTDVQGEGGMWERWEYSEMQCGQNPPPNMPGVFFDGWLLTEKYNTYALRPSA